MLRHSSLHCCVDYFILIHKLRSVCIPTLIYVYSRTAIDMLEPYAHYSCPVETTPCDIVVLLPLRYVCVILLCHYPSDNHVVIFSHKELNVYYTLFFVML